MGVIAVSTADLSHLRAQVEILRAIKSKKAELKELEEHARSAVESALGDADIGIIDGEPVVTWKFHKRTALDQRVLKASFKDVYDVCLRTSEVRRFEICDDD